MNNETKIVNKLSEIFGLPQSQEAIDRRKSRIWKPLGALALAASGALLAYNSYAVNNPTFSEESHSYVMQSGEGLWDAVETIKGIDSIDIRDAVYFVENDPRNQKALSDGLQVGESIEVPDSVETR